MGAEEGEFAEPCCQVDRGNHGARREAYCIGEDGHLNGTVSICRHSHQQPVYGEQPRESVSDHLQY